MKRLHKRTGTELASIIEEKRLELSRAVMSPQARAYPSRNAKQVVRLASELLELAAVLEAQNGLYAKVSAAWEIRETA